MHEFNRQVTGDISSKNNNRQVVGDKSKTLGSRKIIKDDSVEDEKFRDMSEDGKHESDYP